MNTTMHPVAPEEVMALVDGELSVDRAAAVSAHLEACAECSSVAADVRSLSGRMSSWKIEQLPSSLAKAAIAPGLRRHAERKSALGKVPGRRSFHLPKWIVVTVSSVATVLLLFAIAIPNLLRSRMAGNEASAVGSLRTVNTAAVAYFIQYGHYPPSLRSLGGIVGDTATEQHAMLIDQTLADGRKSGYTFTYHSFSGVGSSRGTYTVRAEPLNPGDSGFRHFSTDQTGAIRILNPNGELVDEFPPSAPGSGSVVAKAEPNANVMPEPGPMIARTAELKIAVEKLDGARAEMDRILTQHKGYIAQLSVSAESSSARTLTASLRVPADQLEVCIAELKKLGRVAEESQAGEEVTKRYTDLTARLNNARTTETRLNQVVEQRTGKVTDILEVEKESARVRGEIEQMEAEQKALEHRVDFATIDLKLAEQYKAQLSTPAPSVVMQLRNATINGFRNAFGNLLGIVLFFAEAGPTLLLWLAILGFPVWRLWRRYRRAQALALPS